MGFNDFLKSIFGNKSQRDLREIQPIVDQINRIYPTLAELSNDELRERVAKIKEALAESTADKKKRNCRHQGSNRNTRIRETRTLLGKNRRNRERNTRNARKRAQQAFARSIRHRPRNSPAIQRK